jgi:hypothetical protein
MTADVGSGDGRRWTDCNGRIPGLRDRDPAHQPLDVED